MIHEYKIEFEDFLGLFNINKNTQYDFEEAIMDDVMESCSYHFKNYDWEIAQEVCDRHTKYTKNINQYILDEIESFFNDQVDNCFDDPIEMKILGYEPSTSTVTFTLKTENLESKIGQGMDAWGEFVWRLHAPEDKQSFVEDGYLALRELLHYYEACSSKPKVGLRALTGDFWKYDVSIEEMEAEINEAQSKLD